MHGDRRTVTLNRPAERQLCSANRHAVLDGADDLFGRALHEAAADPDSHERPLSQAWGFIAADGKAVRLGPVALVLGTANALRRTIAAYRDAAAAAAEEFACVQAAHYLPGRCRACEVLGR